MRSIATSCAVGVALATAVIFGATAVPSSALAAKRCMPPEYPGDGYFTSLTVRGTSCATGKRVALAYYRCRIRAGGRTGRCTRRVLRFRCRETRRTIPTQIDAVVTCRRGGARVVHGYQQNT